MPLIDWSRRPGFTLHEDAVAVIRRALHEDGAASLLPVDPLELLFTIVNHAIQKPLWRSHVLTAYYLTLHQLNAAYLCHAVGKQLCLPPDKLALLVTAGMFHDIGKLDQDPNARDTIRQLHPGLSRDVLLHYIPGNEGRSIANFVVGHHERLDGSGYPNKARGADIPVESRIIGGVDVFLSSRQGKPGKPPASFQKALTILKELSGTQLDPVVADALTTSVQNGIPVVPNRRAAQSPPVQTPRALAFATSQLI